MSETDGLKKTESFEEKLLKAEKKKNDSYVLLAQHAARLEESRVNLLRTQEEVIRAQANYMTSEREFLSIQLEISNARNKIKNSELESKTP